MTVVTTTERLASMYALIPGIRQAFPTIPRIINPAQCPAVVIEPGPATYDKSYGEGSVMEIRAYRATLFLELANFGTATQSQINIAPFFDAIRDYFLARPGLELDTAGLPQVAVYDATLLGDVGYVIRPYATGADKVEDFAALTFNHVVYEWARVSYQD